MGKPRRSPSSSSASDDRHQWNRIFKALVDMLQSQQSQIQPLADERKFLEKYIHIQHDHWVSRSCFLESYIAQLKKEEAKGRKIQESKLDLLAEMNHREGLCYKKQCELSESDLEDFRDCVEALSSELSDMKARLHSRVNYMAKLKTGEAGKDRTGVGDSGHVENLNAEKRSKEALEGEIRKVKHSYKKLSSKKAAEVSALLAEKDFVWNQFKKTESDYSAIIKCKKIEIEHANEAIGKLQLNLQELQTTASEKDELIAELKARHELDIRRLTQEAEQANEKIDQLQLDKEVLCSLNKEKDIIIAKLRSEMAMNERELRNSTIEQSRVSKQRSENALKTPTEDNAGKDSMKRMSETAGQGTSQKARRLFNVPSQSSAPVYGIVRCSSKRKAGSDSPEDGLTLFHANFKVPKLKNSPPVAV